MIGLAVMLYVFLGFAFLQCKDESIKPLLAGAWVASGALVGYAIASAP